MDSPRWETRMVNDAQYPRYLDDGWEPYENHDDRRQGKKWVRRRVDINPQSSGDVAKAVQALEELNRKEYALSRYYTEGCEILLDLVGDSKINDAFRMLVRTRPTRRGRTMEEQQEEIEEPEKEQVEEMIDLEYADQIIEGT